RRGRAGQRPPPARRARPTRGSTWVAPRRRTKGGNEAHASPSPAPRQRANPFPPCETRTGGITPPQFSPKLPTLLEPALHPPPPIFTMSSGMPAPSPFPACDGCRVEVRVAPMQAPAAETSPPAGRRGVRVGPRGPERDASGGAQRGSRVTVAAATWV